MARAGDALDLGAQRVRSKRAGGEDGALRAVLVLVQSCDLFAKDANQRLGGNLLRNPPRKLNAIHGQRVAGGNGGLIRNAQQRRTRAPHLLLQQPRRGVGRFALQRIGTDQFAELRRLMGRGQPRFSVHHGPHLIEVHLAAQPRRGQCRLRAGQSAADHANLHCAASVVRSTSPASRLIASPLTRTFRHSSRNSAPMAR